MDRLLEALKAQIQERETELHTLNTLHRVQCETWCLHRNEPDKRAMWDSEMQRTEGKITEVESDLRRVRDEWQAAVKQAVAA